MAITAPHQVRAEDLRKVQDATRWRLVMTERRPDVRAAGSRAWDAGATLESNPYAVLSPEWANWAQGWLDRHQENT